VGSGLRTQEHIKRKKVALYPKRCKIDHFYGLLLSTNRKSHTVIRALIGANINDLGWPWTAETSLLQKWNSFSQPTRKKNEWR